MSKAVNIGLQNVSAIAGPVARLTPRTTLAFSAIWGFPPPDSRKSASSSVVFPELWCDVPLARDVGEPKGQAVCHHIALAKHVLLIEVILVEGEYRIDLGNVVANGATGLAAQLLLFQPSFEAGETPFEGLVALQVTSTASEP